MGYCEANEELPEVSDRAKLPLLDKGGPVYFSYDVQFNVTLLNYCNNPPQAKP